jgi:hypothetical protein
MTYTIACNFIDLEPGDMVPGMRVSDPPVPVLEVFYDSDDGTPTLKTIQAIHRFRWDEKVIFPRRPDGSTINWFQGRKVAPTPEDIAVGDILPPNLPSAEELRRSNPFMASTWDQHFQIVTRLYRSRTEGMYVLKTHAPHHMNPNHDLGHPMRFTYNVFAGRPVTFPREQYDERNIRSGNPEVFGPYEWCARSDGTPGAYRDAELWLYVHPSGRGRWPAKFPPFVPPMAGMRGEFKMRPPSSHEDWMRLTYRGESGKRHPTDRSKQGRHLTYEKYRRSSGD